MKNRRLSFLGSLVLVLTYAGFLSSGSAPQSLPKADEIDLELKIISGKESYSLGEAVVLDVNFINKAKSDFSHLYGCDVGSTGLAVFIAEGDKEFKEYRFNTGSKFGCSVKAGKTLSFPQTVLFNLKPDVRTLSDYGIEEKSRGKVLTDYAFPKPGVYHVKAIFFPLSRPRQEVELVPTRIESEPIKISVYEPVGDELKVWNLMSSNPDIGYLVQKNEPRLTHAPTHEERKKLLMDQIEEAIAENGDGILVNQLKQSLEKWRATERLIKTNNPKYPNYKP